MEECPQHVFQVLTKRPERSRVTRVQPRTGFHVASVQDILVLLIATPIISTPAATLKS